MSTQFFSNDATGAPGTSYEAGAQEIGRTGKSSKRSISHRLLAGLDERANLARTVTTYVSSDSVMSFDAAARMNQVLLSHAELEHESDAIRLAFIQAVYLCMAINSTSVSVPGRASFMVGNTTFDYYTDVVMVIGNDMRRYGRAVADLIRREINRLESAVISGPRADTEEARDEHDRLQEMWNHIVRTARSRNMFRDYDLFFDTADYCTGLTQGQIATINASKKVVLAFQSDARGKNHVDNAPVYRPTVTPASNDAFGEDY